MSLRHLRVLIYRRHKLLVHLRSAVWWRRHTVACFIEAQTTATLQSGHLHFTGDARSLAELAEEFAFAPEWFWT